MRVSGEGISSFSGRRPWWVVAGWIVVLVAAGALANTMLESALDGDQGPTKVLEYERAQMLISERFDEVDGKNEQAEEETGPATSDEFVLIFADGLKPGDAAFDQRVYEFGDALEAAQTADGVEVMVGKFTDYEGRVSDDGTTLLTTIDVLDASAGEITTLLHVTEEFTDGQFEVYMVGNASIEHTFSELAESDLVTGETIGIAIALIILALVFGSVVSAFIPIILAVAAIFTAIGMTSIVGQFMELNEFVPNIISMMGLAVGIDYSLFILSRYKEERERGLDKQAAIEAAGGTAGRAVVFSGLTVVLAMLGMLLIPERTFQAFGIGSILVVFVAVIVGITLLPAIIGILGDKVQAIKAPLPITAGLFIVGVVILSLSAGFGPNVIMVSGGVMLILLVLALIRRFSNFNLSSIYGDETPTDPEAESGVWNTITVNVMRRPWISLIVATTILLILGYFYFDLEKGTSGISVLPDEIPAKIGFQTLDDKFGFGSDAQAVIVIDGDVGSEPIASALAALELSMVDDAGLPAPDVRIEAAERLAVLRSSIPGDPQGQEALGTIRDLRSTIIPDAFSDVPADSYEALVGGGPAEVVDSVQITDEYLPIVFASVLSLSFLLLLLAFRSITISIASIIMNLLSVGAAYGLVVLVFQKGFLIDLFGFEQVDQVEFWLPLFMFSILFGLSMDYHVFMLSRIKERYDQTGLASESVAFGLRKTASIITGAALIMVAVFGGFALGDIAFFQSLGFGLGAAVLIDATIVRSLLVPSVMRILGRHAWYLPSWLEWIPNISIEGHSPAIPTRETMIIHPQAQIAAPDVND
ncbi:MAG: MMPL family transporter [Chloroflexi bacterium]|nr:MMPL family transporter [Chloroflexota bacterium]MDA1281600.1 MMPL family transporter [Chloroflexota bacterium]